MGLNSVQQYVKTLLNGLTIPNQASALEAWVVPPNVENISGPRAYIWGGRMREERQTSPRGAGYTWLVWTVDIYLMLLDNPQSATLDQNFPLLADTVMQTLRTTTMPTFINDPTTGARSQILSVGEEFEWEYPPQRATADMRMLIFEARLGATVKEAIQA